MDAEQSKMVKGTRTFATNRQVSTKNLTLCGQKQKGSKHRKDDCNAGLISVNTISTYIGTMKESLVVVQLIVTIDINRGRNVVFRSKLRNAFQNTASNNLCFNKILLFHIIKALTLMASGDEEKSTG